MQNKKQFEQLQKEQMKRVKAFECQLEEEKKKIEELTAEQEMEQEEWDYDQDGEEYDEDAWAKWHHAEDYTEQSQDNPSKDSSFVVVSTGKEDSSIEEKESEPDMMEALKLVMEKRKQDSRDGPQCTKRERLQ